MSKTTTPSVEDRIRTTLANPNIGSEVLFEIIRDVEAAAVAADAAIVEERAAGLDLVKRPNAKEAHDAVVAAEMTRDRLKANLPRLRDALATELHKEATERWWSSYHHTKKKLDEAVLVFQSFSEHAQAIVEIFTLAAEVDKEVSLLNGSAPDGVDRRLRSTELTARTMTGFTRDNPSLATTCILPDWNHSAKNLWPARPSTSMAAEFSQSMVVPHPGGAWSTPEIQAQKRAEVEKFQRELGEHYAKMTAEQESRQNESEREAFLQQQQRRG